MHKTTITVILFFEFVIHSFILPPFIVSVQWLRIKWWQTDLPTKLSFLSLMTWLTLVSRMLKIYYLCVCSTMRNFTLYAVSLLYRRWLTKS